jgi:thiol-disulfide isomerase/thioredoxin
MKTNFLFILLLFSSQLLLAQVPADAVAIEDAAFNAHFQKGRMPVVTGKVINLTPEEISKTQVTYTLITPFEQDKFGIERNCSLSPDGSFTLTLDYPFPYQQIWISVGELFYAGIYANTELSLELDANLLKPEGGHFNGPGIRYLGKDGPLNTYLNNKVLFKREEWLRLSAAVREVRSLAGKITYPEYQKKYDSVYALFRAMDTEYIRQNPSPFAWLIVNETESDYYSHLCVDYDNQIIPKELFEKIKKHKAYVTSNDGMMFYNYLFGYTDMFSGYHPDAATRAKKKTHVLDSLFASPKADFLKIKCSAANPKDQARVLEVLTPTLKTEWCRQLLQQKFREMSDNLTAINKALAETKSSSAKNLGRFLGDMPFGAKLYRADSLEAGELLAALRSVHNNKGLFIDFWATWCSPCISEFPFSRKLHDQVKDQPVEFIYLCTSESADFEKWKLLIGEHQLAGTHIFVNKNTLNRLMEMFSGSGFPSYAFIDRHGKFQPGVIHRPSHMTREDLVELLKE